MRASARWTMRDAAFLAVFGVYAVGGVVVLAFGIGAIIASVSDGFHESLHLSALLADGIWARTILRMADGAHHLQSWPQIVLDYGFSAVNISLAVFLLWLRPRDITARFLAVGMVGTAGMFNLSAQSTLEIVPLDGVESLLQGTAHMLAGLAYAYALLLFPDGRPVPRARQPLPLLVFAPVALAAAYLVMRAEGSGRPASLIAFFGLVVPVAGVAAQMYRLRTATTAREHDQARLLFWALLPALALGIAFVMTQGPGVMTPQVLTGRGLSELPVAGFRVFQPVFMIIPLALFAGLVHYRLWDINRVVNRTLVYGLLTAILGGAYVAIVVVLQAVLRPFTRGSDLAIAASTLAVAAAFGPARRRMQTFVDRQFYRRQYDAAKAIESFTGRLRDHIDVDAVSDEIRETLRDTMQPAHVTLLLRGASGHLLQQGVPPGQGDSLADPSAPVTPAKLTVRQRAVGLTVRR